MQVKDDLPKQRPCPSFGCVFMVMRGYRGLHSSLSSSGQPLKCQHLVNPDEQVGQIGCTKHPGLLPCPPSVALLSVGLIGADAVK